MRELAVVMVALLQPTTALQPAPPSGASRARGMWSRRCLLAAAPLSALHWPTVASADGATTLLLKASSASSADTAAITAKVRLEFVEQVSAEEKRMLPMVIGLFGKDAPEAVANFKQLCAGELQAPCPPDVDLSQELIERTKQSKKASLRGCKGSESVPVTYAYSSVWSVQKGKRIGAGALQGKFAMRVPPTTSGTESTGLSHDAAGLLSVRRGGGTFDFGITAAPTPEDDADFVVIGRVIEGMDSVEALDAVTIVKAADAFNTDGGLDPKGSRGKVCEYANPQPFCAQGKPLRKITLLRVTVL